MSRQLGGFEKYQMQKVHAAAASGAAKGDKSAPARFFRLAGSNGIPFEEALDDYQNDPAAAAAFIEQHDPADVDEADRDDADDDEADDDEADRDE